MASGNIEALSIKPKFSVQPVEMQMVRADPLVIFRNKLI